MGTVNLTLSGNLIGLKGVFATKATEVHIFAIAGIESRHSPPLSDMVTE